MKKVLLPLLMLVAISSFLLAAESTPSAVVGYVKYPCVEGLNLIAFPMAPGFATAEDFSTAMGGNISTVNKWLPDIQDWYAIDYDEVFGWSDVFTISPGEVVYVNSNAIFDAYSMGPLPSDPSYNMYEGLNLVMVPLNRSDLATISAFGDAFTGNVTTVNQWLNDVQDWYAVDYDSVFGWSDTETATSIGAAFMVNAATAATWPSAKGIVSGKVHTPRTTRTK